MIQRLYNIFFTNEAFIKLRNKTTWNIVKRALE